MARLDETKSEWWPWDAAWGGTLSGVASFGGVGGKLNRWGLECEAWPMPEPGWCAAGLLGKGEHQEVAACAGWGTIGLPLPSEIQGWSGEWKCGRQTCDDATRPGAGQEWQAGASSQAGR